MTSVYPRILSHLASMTDLTLTDQSMLMLWDLAFRQIWCTPALVSLWIVLAVLLEGVLLWLFGLCLLLL